MKKYSLLIFLALARVVFLPVGYAQTIKTVGGAGADYARLSEAFQAINSGAVTGVIELQITGDIIEVATAQLNASGSGSANYTSIVIYPTITGLSVTGNFNTTLIDFNGADQVTLDGRVNRSGSTPDLSIINTSTGTHASALRFIGSAEYNTVRYCNIRSSCYSPGVGMITFTSSTTGNGNDHNIIEYCNITNAGGNRPICAVFSSGSTGRENSGNQILNNNIYNFLNPNSNSYGIILSFNTTDWLISGNHFYDTETMVPTGSFKYYPLFINTGTHTISNNYIGGSAPMCAGSPWVIKSNSAHYFCGIFINSSTVFSTVANNTIANLEYTSVEDNPWDGMLLNSGNLNVTGNTIGSATGTNSIRLFAPVAAATATITNGVVTGITLLGGGTGYTTAPVVTFSTSGSTTPATATATISGGVVTGITIDQGGAGYTGTPNVVFDGQSTAYSTSHGMIQNSSGIVNITGNTIGSITTEGSDYYSHGLEPIYVRGVPSTLTISNNLIGSTTTANSLHVSSGASLSTQKQDLYGIYSAGTGTTIISGNTIANLTNSYSGNRFAARTRGILTISGSNTISNNTIYNISSPNAIAGTGSAASIIGISQTVTVIGTTQIVSGNTIYDLFNTTTTGSVAVLGIYYVGPVSGANRISENLIYNLSLETSNTAGRLYGIGIWGGMVTCANNIINLGTNSPGYEICGIWDECGAGSTSSIYFNTIYLGGTVSSGSTSTTAALFNKTNTSTRNYRNNVLVNNRTGGTPGKHLAVRLEGVANTTIDYNDYFSSSGALGRIATLERADLTLWQAGTGQDVNSLSIDPGFAIPGGTAANDYATSASLPGVSGTGIVTDYFTNTRSASPRMGALEANDYVWQGGTSDVFGLAANWVGGVVPPDGADISFASNPDRHCVLDQNRILRNITNTQGDDHLVLNGKQLTITGDLIFSGGAQIDATAAFSSVVFAGAAPQNIPSGAFVSNTIDSLTINNANGLTLNSDFTINQGIALIAGNFAIGANTLTFNGIVTAMTGTVTGGSATNMIIGGTGSVINMPSFILNNLTINRPSGVSLYGGVSIVGTLTLTDGTFTLGANTLTLSGSAPARTSGFIDASHGGATLAFTNPTAITLPASIFSGAVNNLTINGAGGITAVSDFSINGILNLQSDNPSGTKGSLDMFDGVSMTTLTMGSGATTVGIGDVTGIVKRTAFTPNTPYTFGSPYTSVTFPNVGTLPTDWSVMIKIGSAPAWKTNTVLRTYDIIRTGGSGSLPTVRLHYKDAELNGNVKENLVFWGNYPAVTEYGRVNSDISDNWVSLSGNIEFAPTAFGEREWTLSARESVRNTWIGSSPTDGTNWNVIMNWTGGVPVATDDVVIPAGCTNYPTLPVSTTIQSITIHASATVNGGTGTVLTLTGGNEAWYNRGTFNPGTSTILFTNPAATMSGENNLYNLTTDPGAKLTLTTNDILRIAGSIQNNGAIDATEFQNTVVYNGTNQTVINPNGATPGYHHLILGGNGTKTMPQNDVTIAGNFLVTDTASVQAGSVLSVKQAMRIDSEATYNTGSFIHSIGGDLENYGTFTCASGSTIILNGTSPQRVIGQALFNFCNLTLNNSQGATLLSDVLIDQTLTLSQGNLGLGEMTLGLNGIIDKQSGFIDGSNLSSLSFGGTSSLVLPNGVFLAAPSIKNLTINRSGGVTLGNQSMTINGLLELTSGTLHLGVNTLTIAGDSPLRATGNLDAGDGSATLVFSNPAAIVLPESIFSGEVQNLTISGIGGVTSSGDFTVKGQLYLQAENPSDEKGCLDMTNGVNLKTLTMGVSATTAGVGDVTGIVQRTAFSANTQYSFGNPFTHISFLAGGTLPSEIKVKISIGAAPPWKPAAINRLYDFIQSGGSNCIASITTHYLDSELNGNNENELVQWTWSPGPPEVLTEWGRSNSSYSDNWVTISNVDIGYFPTAFGQLENTLSKTELPAYTWNGSQSTDWSTIENWTPIGSPSSISNIIIPDASTTLYDPVLPVSAAIKSLTLEPAGVLNSVLNAQLTIHGGNGAISNDGGVFNPNTSNVIFANTNPTISGSTNFYDVTINAGTTLGMENMSRMGIANVVHNNGAWRTVIGGSTMVEYNGANQLVVIPNASTNRYSSLTLSGTGIKTMPAAALSIEGDFTVSGAATVTAAGTLTVKSDFFIGSNGTFSTGLFDHIIKGDFENNGTFTPVPNQSITFGGTVSQTIHGSSITNFEELAISNSLGVVLMSNLNCNQLTLTQGDFNIGSGTLGINGDITRVSGYLNPGASATLKFGGTNAITLPNDLFVANPTIHSLIINRSNGVSLGNQDITVNGVLDLTHGILTTGANKIVVGCTGSIANAGTGSHIVGKLAHVYCGAGIKAFPIGKSNEYLPVSIAFTTLSGNSTVVAESFSTGFPGTLPAGVTQVGTRYWNITESGGTSYTYNVTLDGTDLSFPGTAVILKHDAPNTLVHQTYSPNYTANGLTSFSDFALGSCLNPTTGGTITEAQTICSGADPVAFTSTGLPTGHTGTLEYQWQSSITSNSAGFTEITGATAEEYDPPALNQTTWYKRLARSGCVTDWSGAAESNVVSITVNKRIPVQGTFYYHNMYGDINLGHKVNVELREFGASAALATAVTNVAGLYEFPVVVNAYDYCPGKMYQIRATANGLPYGGINTTDAAQLNAYAAGSSIEAVRWLSGDVVQTDGFINATDASAIQQYFVFGTPFTRPGWTFWKKGEATNAYPGFYPVITLTVNNDASNTRVVDMYGMCMGDFSRSFNPSGAKSAMNLELQYGGSLVAGPEQQIEIPVRMVEASQVGAVSLILDVPAKYFEVEDVELVAGGQLDWHVTGNELRIGWHSAMAMNLSAGDELLTLKLKTTPAFTNGATANIALVNNELNELADELAMVIPNAQLSVLQIDATIGINNGEGISELALGSRPNPFNSHTHLTYGLPSQGHVSMEVFNMLGMRVATLVDAQQGAGYHTVTLPGNNLQQGAYVVVLTLSTSEGRRVKTTRLIRN